MTLRTSGWIMAALILVVAIVANGCDDEQLQPTPFDPTSLEAPPEGQGFQAMTDDTVVPPGKEYQDCYFFRVGDLAKAGGLPADQIVNLHRIQIAQRAGSHHFNIFRVRTITTLSPDNGLFQRGEDGKGPCFDSAAWSDWPLIANSQQDVGGIMDWEFPDGVVNKLEPDEWIMFQSHYVNASTQQTPDPGRVVVNFWAIADSDVKHEMGTLFATKQSIRICENNPKPVFSGGCQFSNPEPVRIIGANGHFHSRGTVFDMYSWDGMSTDVPPDSDRFYRSEEWDDPPMSRSPELDLEVPSGSGVFYTCGYRWVPPLEGCDVLNQLDKELNGTPPEQHDCCYTFGPQVDYNEHCNVFLYYYPKSDDINCF